MTVVVSQHLDCNNAMAQLRYNCKISFFFVVRMPQSLCDEITGNPTSILVRLGLLIISDSDISSSCTGLEVDAF